MRFHRVAIVAAALIVIAGAVWASASAIVPVRAWVASVDDEPSILVLIEEGLDRDVDRILARLRGPGGVTLRVVPARDLAALAAEMAPGVIIAAAGIEDEIALAAAHGPDSALLRVTFRYQIESRLVQPWILVSAFPGGAAGDIDSASARSLLGGESGLSGRDVVSRDSLLAEGVTGPDVALARPGDRRVDLQAWTVDGVLPDRRAWVDGAYSLGKDVVVLTRHRDVDGPASALSDLLLPPDRSAGAAALAVFLSSEDTHGLWWGDASEVRLTAVGDISFARRIERRIDEHGLDYPLAMVRDRLAWGDLVVANLESPLGVTGQPIPNKMIWFRARPETVAALVDAGIDIVSVANNHSMDYDVDNFLETLHILDEAGILYIGGGRDLSEARSPLIVDQDGVRIALLAYNAFAHIFWSWSYPMTFEAGPDRPGTAPLRDEVFDWIEEDIRRARQLADVVVVYHHWGEEYRNHPDADQLRWGRRTVDAGADLVLGSHPHAIQGIEVYRGVPIAYSLGNFVFDQNRDITTESMILELVLTADGVIGLNVVPVRLVNDQPRVLHGPDAEGLMDKIIEISRALKGWNR